MTNDELTQAANTARHVERMKRHLKELKAPTSAQDAAELIGYFPEWVTPQARLDVYGAMTCEAARQIATLEAELAPVYAIELPRKWHSGPPPHVGWWNASRDRNESLWRWWDGSEWSKSTSRWDDALSAARSAAVRRGDPNAIIEWSDYWPANARVPRVAP